MTTTVDLVALAAAGQTKVTLLGGTITSLGSTGTDYAGFDDADAVYVEAKVQLRDNSRGAASLTMLIEGSDDGNSWSTLETFTFTNNGTQTATVSTPNDHLRVTWTVARNTEWFIDHVTVAPASLNAPGGGSQPATRGAYFGAGVTIQNNNSGLLTWDTLDFGTDLLNRTAPDQPVLLADGLYALNATYASAAPLTAGGFAQPTISCGAVNIVGTPAFDVHLIAEMTVVLIGTAGDALTVSIQSHDGSDEAIFNLSNSTLIKIS